MELSSNNVGKYHLSFSKTTLPVRRIPISELRRLSRFLNSVFKGNKLGNINKVEKDNLLTLDKLINLCFNGGCSSSELYSKLLDLATNCSNLKFRLYFLKFLPQIYRSDPYLGETSGVFESLSAAALDYSNSEKTRSESMRSIFLMPTSASKRIRLEFFSEVILGKNNPKSLRISALKYIYAILDLSSLETGLLMLDKLNNENETSFKEELFWLSKLLEMSVNLKLSGSNKIISSYSHYSLGFLIHEIASSYAFLGFMEQILMYLPSLRLEVCVENGLEMESLKRNAKKFGQITFHSGRSAYYKMRKRGEPLAYFDPIMIDGEAYLNQSNTVTISYEPWKYNKWTLDSLILPLSEEIKSVLSFNCTLIIGGSLAGPELFSVTIAISKVLNFITPKSVGMIVPREPDNVVDANWFFEAINESKLNVLAIPQTKLYFYNSSDPQIIVITSMGMLASLYAYASVAIIGGGSRGGHNPVEAARYGAITIFDNSMKRNSLAVGELLKQNLGIQVVPFDDSRFFSQSIPSLIDAIKLVLGNNSKNKKNRQLKIFEELNYHFYNTRLALLLERAGHLK